MGKRRRLKSVRAVMMALGGPAAFARLLGRERQSSREYLADKHIPAKFYFCVMVELERLDCHAPYSLFNFAKPSAARGSALLKAAA